MKEKEKSDIIRSIVKLDATDGATDDASCLEKYLIELRPCRKANLKKEN